MNRPHPPSPSAAAGPDAGPQPPAPRRPDELHEHLGEHLHEDAHEHRHDEAHEHEALRSHEHPQAAHDQHVHDHGGDHARLDDGQPHDRSHRRGPRPLQAAPHEVGARASPAGRSEGHSGSHSHGHSHGHSHAHAAGRGLALTLAITLVVLAAEAIGGWLSHSLALLSDAAHMLTDAAALAISLAAVRISRRPPDARRSFGYHRFEILAALVNALLLLAVGVYILYEAWRRLHAPPAIASGTMLWVAVGALLANGLSMALLAGGKDTSLNLKSAYLEVFSDMLGAAGVIVGALVIRLTGWAWVDSVVAVAIGLWVLPRTWALLRESLNVLLEGVPDGLELATIEQALRGHSGVAGVHDLHVWSIASGRPSLTAHVLVREGTPADDALLHALRTLLAERFGLHHSTLQLEHRPCMQGDAAAQGHHDPCWPDGVATPGGHGHHHH